jgi:hypothetical protein
MIVVIDANRLDTNTILQGQLDTSLSLDPMHKNDMILGLIKRFNSRFFSIPVDR